VAWRLIYSICFSRITIQLRWSPTLALFAWLISHQSTVFFSQNKPATSNQSEPASSTLHSEQISTSHQPPANRTGRSPTWLVMRHVQDLQWCLVDLSGASTSPSSTINVSRWLISDLLVSRSTRLLEPWTVELNDASNITIPISRFTAAYSS
jgi:hypothetical protein